MSSFDPCISWRQFFGLIFRSWGSTYTRVYTVLFLSSFLSKCQEKHAWSHTSGLAVSYNQLNVFVLPIRPIFIPERARALRADWAPGPGVLVLKTKHAICIKVCKPKFPEHMGFSWDYNDDHKWTEKYCKPVASCCSQLDVQGSDANLFAPNSHILSSQHCSIRGGLGKHFKYERSTHISNCSKTNTITLICIRTLTKLNHIGMLTRNLSKYYLDRVSYLTQSIWPFRYHAQISKTYWWMNLWHFTDEDNTLFVLLSTTNPTWTLHHKWLGTSWLWQPNYTDYWLCFVQLFPNWAAQSPVS